MCGMAGGRQEGRPSKELAGGLEATGSLQKPPASFQLCNRALSSFANLPLKWLPAFLREASVCRSAKLPPPSLPAVGGSLQPPAAAPRLAPRAGTRGGRGARRSTQTHTHTPRHAHKHTEECIHKGAHTRSIYRHRFSDTSRWLALEQSPSFVGSNKGFQARLAVKVANFKGKRVL